MNKEDFLKELDKKIDVLKKDEREKIIKKYKTQITKRVNKGEDEETVVASYDVDKLAKEILDGYGVKSDKAATKTESKGFFGDLVATIEGLVDSLSKKSGKEILFLLLEIIIILVIVALLKIPFVFIRDLLMNIFNLLGTPFTSVIMKIISISVEIIYILFAIIVFIVIFKKRFEKYRK